MNKREKQFYISPLFVLIMVLMTLGKHWYFGIVYICVLVMHEAAHARAAEMLGYEVSGMRLMPYGASVSGEIGAAPPAHELKIALAGPLFNIAISLIAIATWWIAPDAYAYTYEFVTANLVIAAVNILPVFPLDGGRVVLALFSRHGKRRQAYKIMRVCGLVIALVFAVLAVVMVVFVRAVNISMLTLAVFMIGSTVVPDKCTVYERLYLLAYRRQRISQGLPIRTIMVDVRTPLSKLDSMLRGGVYTRFEIVDDNLHTIDIIDEIELERRIGEQGRDSPVYKKGPLRH